MSSSDNPKLPQDIVVEILKRLPVASLLRFRCVSRSWRATIDDPRFVALHLNHSALSASNWHTVCLDWLDAQQKVFSLPSNWLDGQQKVLSLPSKSQIKPPFVTPPNSYRLVGSSNGLICFNEMDKKGWGHTMYFWNLSTKKHKVVRRSSPGHQHHGGVTVQVGHKKHHRWETAQVVLGFGFDARSNDYKIVRILFYPPYFHGPCFGGKKPLVEIYSFSTDSWRILEREVPAFCGSRPAVFLNGNLHWCASDYDILWDEGGCGPIVLFNLASEVFDEMALPNEIFHIDGLIVYVAVLNDLLALFSSHSEAVGHSVCFVWVMRDYGVPESWTKLYTWKASGLVTTFDGLTLDGELLMTMDWGQKRVSWNPITGHMAELHLWLTCDLVTVVESLVAL